MLKKLSGNYSSGCKYLGLTNCYDLVYLNITVYNSCKNCLSNVQRFEIREIQMTEKKISLA